MEKEEIQKDIKELMVIVDKLCKHWPDKRLSLIYVLLQNISVTQHVKYMITAKDAIFALTSPYLNSPSLAFIQDEIEKIFEE